MQATATPKRFEPWRPGEYIYDSGFSEPYVRLGLDGYQRQAFAAKAAQQLIHKIQLKARL